MPYLIPDVINPPERLCITLRVPNNQQHLQVVWGWLSELSKWYNWERDEAHSGKQLAEIYDEVWRNARESVALGDCMNVFDLRQTGVLIERKSSCDAGWTTLYDPRSYVLLKAPTTTHQNVVNNIPAGVVGLRLNSAIGARAGTNDAILIVEAGWGAPAAIFKRPDNASPHTPTLEIQHNLTGGSAPGLDFIRATDTAGAKLAGINAYGNQVMRWYTELPTPTADHYASMAMLANGFAPDSGVWYCDYDAFLGDYIWRQGIGKTGATGATGATGRNVEFTDPASGVLLPNQTPYIQVFDENPLTQYVKLFSPRMFTLSKAVDIVRNPNQSPTVALSSDVNGDKIVQFGLPRAQKIIAMEAHNLPAGAEATVDYEEDTAGDVSIDIGVPVGENGSSAGFDDILPASGSSKTYAFLVPADTWFNLPFRVPANSTIDNISGRGYWTIQTATNSIVVGSAGTEILGVTEGNLRIGDKENQLTDHFDWSPAVGSHEYSQDSWVAFEMQKYYPTSSGYGWLWVSFRLTRAAIEEITLTYTSHGSGVPSIASGDEFDLILGAEDSHFNGVVHFSVPVNLTLISVTGWSQGPFSVTWDYHRGNGSYGGGFPAPVDVPSESAVDYGVNSATACTIRLRATKA